MRNIVLRNKVQEDKYDALFPKEQATGIEFNNTITNPLGHIGDGSFILPFPARGAVVDGMYLFFLKDSIYFWDENIDTIRLYKTYDLNKDEYFVSHYVYDNALYILTNKGHLYIHNRSIVLNDYRYLLNVPYGTQFYSITYMQGTNTSQRCVAICCNEGVYYNVNDGNDFITFQKYSFDNLALTSTVYKYCQIATFNNTRYLIVFTEIDVVMINLTKTNLLQSSLYNFPNIGLGKFKFIQNDIAVGTNGIWFISEGAEGIVPADTKHITSVISLNVPYKGFLFNNIYWTIASLRKYNSISHDIGDLLHEDILTLTSDGCLIYLIDFGLLKLGINQDGEVIFIRTD